MMVMSTAITPSLNASSRVFVIAQLPDSFLLDRLDSQPPGQLIESRQIRCQRALQAIGFAFQLGLEILEYRRSIPHRLAVAGRHRTEQRGQTIVRPDGEVEWI